MRPPKVVPAASSVRHELRRVDHRDIRVHRDPNSKPLAATGGQCYRHCSLAAADGQKRNKTDEQLG